MACSLWLLPGEVLAAHPHPEDGFVGMEIRGDMLTDKENAGAALLDACKEVKTSDPVQIGSYQIGRASCRERV